MNKSPLIRADYPDVDVICVGDTYYMISTTMHFFPGGVILRSHDLLHWETAAHVYDTLDSTPRRRMEEGNMYSQGMWAASLRHHEGVFHAVFSANDTHRTYHYTAEAIEGPWTLHPVEGFDFHFSHLIYFRYVFEFNKSHTQFTRFPIVLSSIIIYDSRYDFNTE